MLSTNEGKSLAAIAEWEDMDPRALQRFLGQSDWPWQPVLDQLAERVLDTIAEPDGILVVQPLGVEKRGSHSVGVARQRPSDHGPIRNCQLSVELGYITRSGTALVDGRLYLPEEWTDSRARCERTGVPQTVDYATLSALAVELAAGARGLPSRWIVATSKLFDSLAVRGQLRDRNLPYLIHAPRDTRVRRVDPVRQGKRTRSRKYGTVSDVLWDDGSPLAWRATRVDSTAEASSVEAASIPVVVADRTSTSDEVEILLAIRQPVEFGTAIWTYFANAPLETPLTDLVQAATAPRRLDEYIGRAISHTGLTAYEVRNWRGWHHHHTLALVAAWIDQSTLRNP